MEKTKPNKQHLAFLYPSNLNVSFSLTGLIHCKNGNLYAAACTAECSLEITRQLGNGENVCKTDTFF